MNEINKLIGIGALIALMILSTGGVYHSTVYCDLTLAGSTTSRFEFLGSDDKIEIMLKNVVNNTDGSQITGSRSIVMNCYDSKTGGTLLWTETQTADLLVNGTRVVLGNNTILNISSVTPFLANDTIGDKEMNYSAVTLNDFTNNALFWMNESNITEFSYWNNKITLSQVNITNEDWIEDSDESSLNVNGSSYWDALNTPIDLENLTKLSCHNITGATSNLCTLTDTTYSNTSFDLEQLSGGLNWTQLQNYPSVCTASQYISAFGDTLSCTAIAIGEEQITIDAAWDIGSYAFTAQTLIADVADGTSPLTITSKTQVSNLNSSYAGTAYDLVAASSVVSDAEVDDDLTIATTSDFTVNKNFNISASTGNTVFRGNLTQVVYSGKCFIRFYNTSSSRLVEKFVDC